MASHISSYVLFFLVAGYHCAPGKWEYGYDVEGHSRTDVRLGGSGVAKMKDGVATVDANGLANTKWKGDAAVGGFLRANNHILASNGSVGANVNGAIETGVNGQLGVNSKGNVPFKLVGTGSKILDGHHYEKTNIATDEDAERLAELYGYSGKSKTDYDDE